MNWFIHVYAKTTTLHGPFASLELAMRWHHENCFRSRGMHNHGWWYHPQIDPHTGEINFISFDLPARDLTDAEMASFASTNSYGSKRREQSILKNWRDVRPQTTDFARGAENADFIMEGMTAVHFSREDRMRGEIAEARSEGNDRSEDQAALAALPKE